MYARTYYKILGALGERSSTFPLQYTQQPKIWPARHSDDCIGGQAEHENNWYQTDFMVAYKDG